MSTHTRNARRAADQNHFVDLVRRQSGIAQRLLHRFHGALQQVFHQLLELRPRQLQLHVLRPGRIRRQERQVDLGLLQLRKLDLGFFRRFLQPLDGHAILAHVDALVALEFGDHPLDDALVDVVAAQVRVAVGGLHFHHAFAHFQDGNIERTAAQVVHGDRFVLFLVQAVRQRRRCRLVDDAQHFQARDLTGLLGGLPLAVVEIRRHGNYSLGDFFAQEVFRGGLQFLKNHRRNFRRTVRLAGNLHARVVVRPLHNL